jgi:hypothetical protein
MLLSTSYNSLSTVLSNLRHCFTEVAQKCYYYIHSLPGSKQPASKLVIRKYDPTTDLSESRGVEETGILHPENPRGVERLYLPRLEHTDQALVTSTDLFSWFKGAC